MIQLAAPMSSLLENKTHRWSTCWKITRKDGTVMRFTDHDSALMFNAEVYTPVGGFNPSAHQMAQGLADRNQQFTGVITSDDITFEDLRAGKYRGAKVEEMLVDWEVPWAGAFFTAVYWIAKTRFTGEIWTAELEGLTRFLKQDVGRVYSRTCDAQLGDSRCQLDLTAFTFNGTITGINTQRLDFTTDVSQPTNYFNLGKLTWTLGNNTGIVTQVRRSYGTAGRMILQLKTDFDLQVGDQFTVIAGCDLLASTCQTKFSNIINFQGFPTIPGHDKMLQSPNRKSST